MKKLIKIFSLAFFSFLIVHCTLTIEDCVCQWQPDVRLTNAPDTSRTSYHNSNIASNGNFVHVVWYDKRDGNFEIYYKRSTDGGINWSSDTRLTNYSGYSLQPSCTVNGSVVHVAWCDNRSGTYQVYYKRSTDAGLTWGADTSLTSTIMSTYFYPHLVSSGLLMFITWYDNRDGNNEIYYKRSIDGGTSWGADSRLTNDPAQSSLPSVAISGSNVHIVWYDNRDGNNEIYYKRSTDGGSIWSTDTRLTNDPASSQVPNIALSGSNVYVVWYDMRDGNWEIYYKFSANGGINWDVDTRLTNDPSISSVPSVAISGSNVHIIWHDYRDGNYEIYYKLSTDGGINWGTDTRLTYDPAMSAYPSISISNSVLHVVWLDERDGNYEIYYKRNPTGNPMGIVPISTEIPKEYKLMQNYPNPFNPSTVISFQLLVVGKVSLKVYDELGRELATLVNEKLNPGTYEVTFDGSKLTSGVYFYRLQSGEFTDTKRLVLLK